MDIKTAVEIEQAFDKMLERLLIVTVDIQEHLAVEVPLVALEMEVVDTCLVYYFRNI